MSTNGSRRVLWYTRRGSVVRGPYPDRQISRYILLGRIRDPDELKTEDGEWAVMSDHPELIPDVMKLPSSEENRQLLLIARMREDERTPGDRRDRNPVPQSVRERRGGEERRREETDDVLRHRQLKYKVAHTVHRNGTLYRYPLVFTVIVLIGFAISYLMGKVEPETVPPDCSAGPRPGVDWNHCNLTGAKLDGADLVGAKLSNVKLNMAQLFGANLSGTTLDYASFDLANLEQANLSHANLFGATLRGANLRAARLVEANLAYTNLSGAVIEGADLSGAVLDNAIWVDERICLPGSRGRCLFPKQ